MDMKELANIFGQETVKRVYEDVGSPGAKESGEMLKDAVKTFRLFVAPIQFFAAWQDRLRGYLDKVRAKVPEQNQIESPPSISGPILERLKYQEENNPLTDLYLNLLARSIDKERINEAHPGFYHIIDQISSDEAVLLYNLLNKNINFSYTRQLEYLRDNYVELKPWVITNHNFPELIFPNYFSMYFEHLRSLSLLEWRKVSSDPTYGENNRQDGIKAEDVVYLSEFGKLFVKACIPEKGFIIVKK